MRIPSEPVEINGINYQVDLSPEVATKFKEKARRLGLSEEELIRTIYSRYGDVNEKTVWIYLRPSD